MNRPVGRRTDRRAVQGASLVVALILLAVVAMLGIGAWDASTRNARVTRNMQLRAEATDAAQHAIEQTLSNRIFTADPEGVAAAPIPVDIDGDGNTDWTARLDPAPVCTRVRDVPMAELDPGRAEDMPCFSSATPTPSGLSVAGMPAGAGESLCADTEWTVRAVVDDPRTGVRVAVNQGVSVRILSFDATSACR